MLWAVVLFGGALLYGEQKTPVVTLALGIASFTYGALLGSFFLGILVKKVNQADALLKLERTRN